MGLCRVGNGVTEDADGSDHFLPPLHPLGEVAGVAYHQLRLGCLPLARHANRLTILKNGRGIRLVQHVCCAIHCPQPCEALQVTTQHSRKPVNTQSTKKREENNPGEDGRTGKGADERERSKVELKRHKSTCELFHRDAGKGRQIEQRIVEEELTAAVCAGMISKR